jgi:hypothetical protein
MKRALSALLLLLAAACSSDEPPIANEQPQKPAAPPPPSVQQARDLIANAPEFGEYEFTNASFTTPVSGVAMSEPSRQAVRELAAGGWLMLENTGDIALTEKSRNDKRFLLRPNGLLDIVPLAKKEMGAVRGVSPQPDGTAVVDFTWRWIANEVGAAFKTGPVHDRFTAEQDGRATLIWDGTAWSVLKIE